MGSKLPWVSRDAYERLCADHQALQDRLRSVEAQSDYLRGELDVARRDATQGREMVCDWLALQVLGRKIFGTAPDLPVEQPDRAAIERMAESIPTARSMAKKMTQQFADDYKRKIAELRANNQMMNEAGAHVETQAN